MHACTHTHTHTHTARMHTHTHHTHTHHTHTPHTHTPHTHTHHTHTSPIPRERGTILLTPASSTVPSVRAQPSPHTDPSREETQSQEQSSLGGCGQPAHYPGCATPPQDPCCSTMGPAWLHQVTEGMSVGKRVGGKGGDARSVRITDFYINCSRMFLFAHHADTTHHNTGY